MNVERNTTHSNWQWSNPEPPRPAFFTRLWNAFKGPREEIIEIEKELKVLDPNDTKEIISKIVAFVRKFPQEAVTGNEWLELVKGMEESAKMNSLSKFQLEDNGVLHVPDDGNCAYHAASSLLSTQGDPITHEKLRGEVQAWLKNNSTDELVAGYLDEALKTYNSDLEKKYNDSVANMNFMKAEKMITGTEYEEHLSMEKRVLQEKKLATVDDYLTMIGQTGVWAGLPELYAIGMIHKIQIKVSHTAQGDINLHEGLFQGNITLVYDYKPGAQGSHYNGLIK